MHFFGIDCLVCLWERLVFTYVGMIGLFDYSLSFCGISCLDCLLESLKHLSVGTFGLSVYGNNWCLST